MLGTVNDFVDVTVNSTANVINCTFVDQQSTSVKMCSVEYRLCSEQVPVGNTNGSVNGSIFSIILMLSLDEQSDYCYTVSASNGDYTVEVEGSIIRGK